MCLKCDGGGDEWNVSVMAVYQILVIASGVTTRQFV